MAGNLERWNTMSAEDAAEEILPCCGSRAWSAGVVELRPIASEEELLDASDRVWRSLPQKDWQQAFDSHPRIGERDVSREATAQSLQWSAGEQSAITDESSATKAKLAEANRAYEAKFGRIFIICASGKSSSEILASLEERMKNNSDTELANAAEEQRKITQLRLQKWLAEGGGR